MWTDNVEQKKNEEVRSRAQAERHLSGRVDQ